MRFDNELPRLDDMNGSMALQPSNSLLLFSSLQPVFNKTVPAHGRSKEYCVQGIIVFVYFAVWGILLKLLVVDMIPFIWDWIDLMRG